MKQILRPVAIAAVALCGAYTFAQGPGSKYYLTGGTTLWTLQGTGDTSVTTQSNDEYNIAVDGDIRTTQYRSSGAGYQYSLNSVPTGTTYPGTWLGFFDGTTDGTHNYTVDWDTGNVWSFNRDWQNGSVLFTLPGGASQYLGITYDNAGGLWVSQWTGSLVQHYSMNGTLLGGFDSHITDMSCLGMDYATGTLWFGSQTKGEQFWNFDTSGNLLGTETYTGLAGSNTLGGEFNLIAAPEPFTVVGTAIGCIALLRRRIKTNA